MSLEKPNNQAKIPAPKMGSWDKGPLEKDLLAFKSFTLDYSDDAEERAMQAQKWGITPENLEWYRALTEAEKEIVTSDESWSIDPETNRPTLRTEDQNFSSEVKPSLEANWAIGRENTISLESLLVFEIDKTVDAFERISRNSLSEEERQKLKALEDAYWGECWNRMNEAKKSFSDLREQLRSFEK